MRSSRFLAPALLLAGASIAQAQSCGPFPDVPAKVVDGWCASTVATNAQGLRMPRSVLWMGRSGTEEQLLVVDMGNWEPKRGRLLHVRVDTAKGTTASRELLSGLDRPHGLRKGPDGRIWLGEVTRISRFAWPAQGAVALEPVITGLPAEGRHPLKQFVFGPDGTLWINAGAATDSCEKQGSTGADGRPACPEMAGKQPQAAVYRAQFRLPQGELKEIAPFATGLRNSMALAVHASGKVFQGENNIDLPDAKFPGEEINLLEKGGHYGWPGCVEMRKPLPGFTAAACAGTRAPVLLMPAHTAPLHMEFSKVPAQATQGLLVSWHGYQPAGQRLVRYETGADGIPKGKPRDLIHSWQIAPGKPGAPVGWAEDDAGHLWIADDRNRMLVWFHKAR